MTATQKMFGEALRHHQAGRLAEADRLYRQILAAEPRHADSLHLLGVLGHRAGQLDAAITLIRQALGIKGDSPAYHSNLANVLKDQGKLDEAVEHYSHALTLKPDFAEAHYNLGCTLQDQGKLKEACTHYERAIQIQPKLAAAHINLGNTVKALGRVEESIAHYERALAIDPASADAHYNLATAFKDQGRFDEAIQHYRHTLDLQPDHVEALNNTGVLLRDRGQVDDALRHFRRATAVKPDHAEAHVNEAMALLLAGDYAQGWKKYEWRWRLKGTRPLAAERLWTGGDVRGKTILLCSEQGLGDCIQFVRYAPLVKARGARVLLSCPPALARLLQSVEGIDQIIPEGSATPDYDFHVPLMSLPMLFGTTLETVPNKIYLRPPESEVTRWAERLGSTTGLKVGLVWAGNSRRHNPDAHAVDQRRSISLAQLAPLADIPGIQFVSLQKGEPAQQQQAPPPGLNIIDCMDEVQDFADTAALIANLDLVIGVDTSVIHVAGAMGKPVWVLSRFDRCWRWLLNREDSPWYPTLRIFAQPEPGDWESCIKNMCRFLKEKIPQG